MRPLQPADLEAAVRALLAAAPERRGALAAQIVKDAQMADRYRKRLGRAHPDWGTGTLMSAAARHVAAARPDRLHRTALQAYATLIDAILHQSA